MPTEKYSIGEMLKEENPIQDQIDDLVLELIRARKRKKISQVQLSNMIDIPQVTISRIESFRNTPTLPILLKMANALGLFLFFRGEAVS